MNEIPLALAVFLLLLGLSLLIAWARELAEDEALQRVAEERLRKEFQ